MSEPRPIGKATWAGGRRWAVLLADRTWRSDLPEFAEDLGILYPATSSEFWGPSAGRPGVKLLRRVAAEWFGGGEVEVRGGGEPEPEGRVY